MTPSAAANRGPSFAHMRVAPPLLLAAGFALAAWLVRDVGAERVLGIVRASGPLLPVIALLEATFATCDAIAVRVLLSRTGNTITPSTWVRATALAYASTILLPAGRMAGEAVRATTLSRRIGAARAVLACSRLQICALVANTILCLACIVAAPRASGGALATALALNVVACSALAAGLLGLVRSKRLAAWIRGRFAPASDWEASVPFAEISRATALTAQSICILGRVAQTAQYGVVLYAVGGTVTPTNALTAQGVHLVGASVGDLVPGQLGAMEGAYRAFASALGFGADLARALSIPLVVRIVQLGIALVCLSVGWASAAQPSGRTESP